MHPAVSWAATPREDGRASGDGDFGTFHGFSWGKTSGVLRPGSDTRHGAFWGTGMAPQEEPAGDPP